MKIPMVGLGTWELRGHECTKVVKTALEIGYRHIDTAANYDNHEAVGEAIKHFDRSKLFITTKFGLDQIDPQDIESSVHNACRRALKELGVDYIDLYLIHWPDRNYPLSDIFEIMEELIAEGKIKHAGVSNFTKHHLHDLAKTNCKPAANQVEFHPYLYQKELWDYCKRNHIQLIAYRSFGKKALLKDSVFEEIGHQHKKNSAQVILRWLIQKGIPSIPKAANIDHLIENFAVFDFTLTPQEMSLIDQQNHDQRFCMAEEPEFKY